MAEGAKAHGENNYHKGRGDAAFVRDRVNHAIEHLLKYASGDRTEDHLAAVRANTGMLIWLESANRSETTTPPKIATTAWAIGRFYCPVKRAILDRLARRRSGAVNACLDSR